MKEIKLTQGRFALIDDEDYELIAKHKWYAVNYHDHYYAVMEIKGKQIKMHRLILNAPNNTDIDHIDGDGLNNQKSNLRLCTASQNAMNAKKCVDGKSKYKGVWICKEGKKIRIRAGIRINFKLINLGSFNTETQAAKAYDEAAKIHFGEFANLNFR